MHSNFNIEPRLIVLPEIKDTGILTNFTLWIKRLINTYKFKYYLTNFLMYLLLFIAGYFIYSCQ